MMVQLLTFFFFFKPKSTLDLDVPPIKSSLSNLVAIIYAPLELRVCQRLPSITVAFDFLE